MSALNSNNTFDGLDEPVRPTPGGRKRRLDKENHKKQKVVFNRLTLEAVAFGVPFRAPASRARNPGSRPVRCDGADPGGLHQHKAGATGL